MYKIILSAVISCFAYNANAISVTGSGQATGADYGLCQQSSCEIAENNAQSNASSLCRKSDSTSYLSTFRVTGQNTQTQRHNDRYVTVSCIVSAEFTCY